MGSRNTDRVLRLRDLRVAAPGTLRIGVCKGCRHRSGLPLGMLIARFGEDHAAHLALFSLHCSGCGRAGQVDTPSSACANQAAPSSAVKVCPQLVQSTYRSETAPSR